MSENFLSQTFSRVYSSTDDLDSSRHHQIDTNRSDETVHRVLRRSIKEQIRDRAYELYLQRGCRDGHELDDWLDAEFEMLANR